MHRHASRASAGCAGIDGFAYIDEPYIDACGTFGLRRSIVDLSNLVIEERFVRASGPGGQNVNKVATAVQLRLELGSAPLAEELKVRLRALAGSRLTSDDVLVIDAREYRSQAQNREAARARLSALLDQAAVRPRKRRPTKPSGASKERRLTSKRRRSATKQQRRGGGDEN